MRSRNLAIRPRILCVGTFLLVAAIALFGCDQSLATEPASNCPLEEFSSPSFWVINTRCSPRCKGLDAGFETLKYERYCCETRRFVVDTRDNFLAEQSQLPTLFFVHGNSLEHEGAMENAWQMYHRMKVCPGPKMLVLWSWPAQVLYKRPLIRPLALARKNIKAKYVYAEHQGYYLAKLVSQMSVEQPVTLGGHSFGAACCLVAAHYLGGGQLNGLCLEGGVAAPRPGLRASLISPALDNDHLYAGHRYSQAIVALEQLHTTYSAKDATLRRWPTHSVRNQQALGFTGLCIERLGEHAHKVTQNRLTEEVGRSHYMATHLASIQMTTSICQTAFGTCPVGGGTGSGTVPVGSRVLPSGRVNLDDVLRAPAQLIFPGLAL